MIYLVQLKCYTILICLCDARFISLVKQKGPVRDLVDTEASMTVGKKKIQGFWLRLALSPEGAHVHTKRVSLTGLGVEILGFVETEEIASLTAARIQSLVPGHGSAGDKLVAGTSLRFFKQSVATLFCSVTTHVFIIRTQRTRLKN